MCSFDKNHHSLIILQVLPALDTGGVERGCIDVVKAIRNLGAHALVAAAPGRLINCLKRAGGKFIPMDLQTKNPLKIYRNGRSLVRLTKTFHVDLLHVRSRAPAWSVWYACRITKKPMVTTWHGLHGIHGSLKPWKKFYNSVMVRADRVIAVSNFIASHLKYNYNIPDGKLIVIPRGTDCNKFNPANVSGKRVQTLAERWALPLGDRKIIMVPGRLTRWKGQLLMLEALARMSSWRKDDDWIYLIVGPDKDKHQSYAKKILSRSVQLGLRNKIWFGGDCDDMPAAYQLADVVVVPSLQPEPFGRTVTEAQAMEKPVLVAGHGGAAETVKNGATGIWFTPGQVDDLARKLAELLDMSLDTRHQLGHNARQHVVTHYGLEKMYAATFAVYQDLLNSSLIVKKSPSYLKVETESF